MKIFSVLFLIIFSFCLFSCSTGSNEKTQSEDFTTLKAEADSISSKTTWTEEIEKGRLTDKIKTEGLSSKVKSSVLSVSALKEDNPKFVFPSLPGFGSLDTELIPLNLKSELLKFCESFSKNDDLTSFSRKESLYNLALFYYDLSACLPEYENFFSFENDENVAAETPEKEKTETEAKKFFSSYKLGEPFIDGINYEVPVRFVSEEKILTLETYWTIENSKWTLDQIQILTVDNSNLEKKDE